LSPRDDPNYAKRLRIKLKPEHTSILELEGKLGYRESTENMDGHLITGGQDNTELSLSPDYTRR